MYVRPDVALYNAGSRVDLMLDFEKLNRVANRAVYEYFDRKFKETTLDPLARYLEEVGEEGLMQFLQQERERRNKCQDQGS